MVISPAIAHKDTLSIATTPQKDNDNLAFLQKGIYKKLTQDGQSYLKFTIASQFWMRYAELNPGSVNRMGDTVASGLDFGLRRSRLILYANFNDRIHFLGQLGSNSQTFGSSKKPQLFLHDFQTMLRLVPKKLYVGFGLHYWNGISRLTNTGFVRHYMIDHPISNYPNLERSDQMGRQIGIFAKGQLGNWDYRMALNQPFAYDEYKGNESVTNKAMERGTCNLSTKGYLQYFFRDKEQFNTPFTTMTYLGKKRLLNIGAGFDYHPKSCISISDEGEKENFHDRIQLGVDINVEQPFANGSALNLYSVFYHYNFGPNYIRSAAPLNPYTGGSINGHPLEQGAGLKEFVIGTGNIVYTSIGYLLPKLENGKQLMPMLAIAYRDFEALDEVAWQFNFGCNYLLSEHNLKLTAQYTLRPIFASSISPLNTSTTTVDSYKGMLLLQFQFVY